MTYVCVCDAVGPTQVLPFPSCQYVDVVMQCVIFMLQCLRVCFHTNIKTISLAISWRQPQRAEHATPLGE